jgi:hypothetical protein
MIDRCRGAADPVEWRPARTISGFSSDCADSGVPCELALALGHPAPASLNE